RPRGSHFRVRGAVLELEELDGELDVGERALAQLEMKLRILTWWDALLLDAQLDAPDLADVVLGERFARDERFDQLEEPARDAVVTRNGTGAQQRLELPRES